MGFRVVEDAGDRRQRIIGRVIFESKFSFLKTVQKPAKMNAAVSVGFHLLSNPAEF
jgi:hypothetical protein